MLASRLHLRSIVLRTLHMRVANFMFSLVLWNMEYNKKGITMQRIGYPVPVGERRLFLTFNKQLLNVFSGVAG